MSKRRPLDKMMRDFGVRLRAARIIAGYDSAADFAKDLGIGYNRYTKNERGESIPRLDVLDHMCTLTNVTADYLLRGKQPKSED